MNKKIVVLHAFIWFSIKKGGGTTDLLYKILLSQQKNKQISPAVICTDDFFDEKLRKELSQTYFIKTKPFYNLFFNLFFLLSFFRIYKIKPDIIHMHIYRSMQNVFLYFYSKITNTPYIMDAHGSIPFWNKGIFKKKLYDFIIGRRILNESSLLVAETDTGVIEYNKFLPKVDSKKIKIIRPPFGVDEYLMLPDIKKNQFRTNYSISKNSKVITFLGRLHPDKGNMFLLKGINKLVKQGVNLICVLIGPDDGDEENLKNFAKKNNIEKNVLFIGFKSGLEKNQILQSSDIVIQLSKYEQGAWAPIEGILCEAPIIVTKNTGSGEDVTRMNAGYLVEYGNVEELTDTILYVFKNKIEAKTKAIRARQYIIDNLSMDARMIDYINAYREVIR